MSAELWDVRCPSCGELWPARAFRVLRFFTVRRCQVCRKAGPKIARFVHYMRWPFGVSAEFRSRLPPEEAR